MKSNILLGTAVATSLGLTYYFYQRYNRRPQPPPTNWKLVGQLEEIVHFPLKSCSGIATNAVTCDIFGLRNGSFYDRMLMLIDKEGKIGSAGYYPKMLQITTEIMSQDVLKVMAPDMEPITIDLTAILEGDVTIRNVDGGMLPVIECGQKYADWFSKFLLGAAEGFRLGFCAGTISMKAIQELNFYMAMTTQSVEDLNSRLANKVHHRQFRGNFLIKTDASPYAEDSWKWMKIGDSAIFKYSAPCFRCILPNIDIFTAKRDPDCEPLRTLKKYRMRKHDKEPVMGAYFKLYQPGSVQKWDDVFVA